MCLSLKAIRILIKFVRKSFAHDTTGIQTLQQEEMTTPVTTPVTSPESAENVDTPSFEDEKRRPLY